MVAAVSDLIRQLGELPLLQPNQLPELERLHQRLPEPRALVQHLVQNGWLTAFQGNRLLQGQAASLVMRPYVLLDRLGEGGVGQVFKARHLTLNRIVALKVLRPEMVVDSEAVSRFYREVTLAGHLPDHPNLIRAYDAGPFGSTHFLTMEFIAGVDLERLVKQSGPLPIERACDYIRQAALGLQHAHQHGLVHRDIKPSNLLVSNAPGAPPTVKVLDLGLARLHDGKGPRENAFLTTDGAVTLGTVDYQAPEQALDFHRADTRADIYSLGCTFFFLLTGKPPFGSGPLAVKLMRHQQAVPPDLKERRPDIPDAVIPIVLRMLAKSPDDRYQSPGEVAAALTTLAQPGAPAAACRGWRPSRRHWLATAATGGAALLLAPVAFLLSSGAPSPETRKAPPPKPAPPPPPPGSVEATVPEARDYQVVYDLNLAKLTKDIVYDENRQAQITRPFDRIAYFIELQSNTGEPQYLYVSMTAFTTDVKKIGIPTFASGAFFQQNVASMNVYSNVSGIVTGAGIATGNIEFWPNNYGPHNGKNVPNADSGKYDFGDQSAAPQDGYGSMQVHNYQAKQTLFAINHWSQGGRAEIGIGNSPTGNPDYTFTSNGGIYRTKRLRVLVRCP